MQSENDIREKIKEFEVKRKSDNDKLYGFAIAVLKWVLMEA